MQLAMDKTVSAQAIKFIKANKPLLIKKFANPNIYQPVEFPETIFMAGSPGAGKTEFSKNLTKILKKEIVRIDADEIREIIPQYAGSNSIDVQAAASIGVEKLYDYVLRKKIDAIIDGTFASYNVAYKNVRRSINKDRNVIIFYIYQKPEIAWDFTVKREKLEGRYIPKEIFIKAFFDAKGNVNKIKEIFQDRVKIFLVVKNYDNTNDVEKSRFNIDNVDNYLKIEYTSQTLEKMLK